jgi:hypothetical protein
MAPRRYSVQHWYPDARGWAEYFETDSLRAARAALESADPPDVHLDQYDYTMRNVRRRNRRRVYDAQEGQTLQECEPELRFVVGDKLLVWGVPMGAILLLVLGALSTCD